MSGELEQKDNARLNIWFFCKLVISVILITKAADGFFPIFDKSFYNPEAQELFRTLEKLPSANLAITGFHLLVGSFLLWNIMAPFVTLVSLPLLLFAVIFEVSYGTAFLPQALAILALACCLALLFHYKNHMKRVFIN